MTKVRVKLFDANGDPLPTPWSVGMVVYAKIGMNSALVKCVITSTNPLAYSVSS